jgi:hypothetical protein
LLSSVTGDDPFAGLLSARHTEMPEGANQFGKTVKVLPHGRQIPRRTQMRSCRSSWAWRSRRPWPMIVLS